MARDDGATVTELDTSWLSTPHEGALIQARIEAYQQDAQAEHVNDAVGKILAALRAVGYQPSLRIEDVEIATFPAVALDAGLGTTRLAISLVRCGSRLFS